MFSTNNKLAEEISDNDFSEDVKMSEEMAEEELKKWVFSKQGNLSSLKDNKAMLIKAMQSGSLILNSDGGATYKLKFPIMGQDSDSGKETVHVDTLTFKPRLKYKEIKNLLRKVDPNDNMGQSLAYTAGLTGQSVKILEELDISDLTKVQLVSVFFIV